VHCCLASNPLHIQNDKTAKEKDMDRFWLKNYPKGVPADIDCNQYKSLVQLIEEAFRKHGSQAAYNFMGAELTYSQLDQYSAAVAAWLQSRGFGKGKRVAIMMPNVMQYPIALAGILRAGCTVVNVNPLYTPRELEHQLKDSGTIFLTLRTTKLTSSPLRKPSESPMAQTTATLVGTLSATSWNTLAKFSRMKIASAPESFSWCSSSRGV
jgi:acyl-CoA synthetase (AMP-forming)/AMP-acid ligase II